jgi:hypothetical protein
VPFDPFKAGLRACRRLTFSCGSHPNSTAQVEQLTRNPGVSNLGLVSLSWAKSPTCYPRWATSRGEDSSRGLRFVVRDSILPIFGYCGLVTGCRKATLRENYSILGPLAAMYTTGPACVTANSKDVPAPAEFTASFIMTLRLVA